MNDNALLKNKGRVWVLDESAGTKKFVELSVVDNVQITHPANPVEIKTPSGVTIFKSMDMDAQLSFDLYHPGDLSAVERLFRGAVSRTAYDGSTAQAGEEVTVSFRNAGEAFVLPGYNGDKTAVTVNSVKLASDLTTTYSVTTDYTVSADSETGMTLLTHVDGGNIAAGADVIVNYDYTPLESSVLRPDEDGTLIDRFIVVDSFVNCNDTTKYRRYFLPRATVTSDLVHQLLDIGEDNQSPNILPVTLEYKKPDACTSHAQWYWLDTVNV